MTRQQKGDLQHRDVSIDNEVVGTPVRAQSIEAPRIETANFRHCDIHHDSFQVVCD
jgi:hypothetical protein